MNLKASVYQLLSWNEFLNKEMANPSLLYLANHKFFNDFLKTNEDILKANVEKHQSIIQNHFDLDESGKIKQKPVFKDVPEKIVVKKKTRWSKEVSNTVTKHVPNGQEPCLKEGKTMEAYQEAMKDFMSTEVEVIFKPKVFSKFPIVL